MYAVMIDWPNLAWARLADIVWRIGRVGDWGGFGIAELARS